MRRFNQVEWIGFILLAALVLYLTYLLREGEMVSFIHPKRIPMMWAALGGLITLVAYQSTKIFTIPSRKTSLKSYLSLGIVLLGGVMTLSAKETDRFSTTQASNNISIASSGVQADYEASEPFIEEAIRADAYANNWAQEEVYEEIITDEEIVLSDPMIITNENYIKVLSDIEVNPDRYRGKKMIIEGFVFRDPQFEADEFVIARMYMICCAADAQITGLLCKGSESINLPDDQWVRVEGMFEVQNYEMDGVESLMPIIKISEVEPLITPENQYIYY